MDKPNKPKPKFKVHTMYKGKQKQVAQNLSQHNLLEKMGFTHKKPM